MSTLVIHFENMAMVALERSRSRVFLPKAGHTAKVRIGNSVIEFKRHTPVKFLVNGVPLKGTIATRDLMVYQSTRSRPLRLKNRDKVESLSLAEIDLGKGTLEAGKIVSTVQGADRLIFDVGDGRTTGKYERLTNRMKFTLNVEESDRIVMRIGTLDVVLKEPSETRIAKVTFVAGEKRKRKVTWKDKLSDARMSFRYVEQGDTLRIPKATNPPKAGQVILGDPICVAIVIAFFAVLSTSR